MIHLQRVPDTSRGFGSEEQEHFMETPVFYNSFHLI